MNEILGKMTSLGLAVALSPELLLLGLWLAASRERGVQKAWSYFFGGTVGLLVLVAAGFMIRSGIPEGQSWAHFILRGSLSLIMLLLGLRVLIKKSGPKKEAKTHYDAAKVGIPLAFLFGFLITTINIKITAIGLSAGKHLNLSTLANVERVKALALFIAICDIPIVLPALVESVRSGLSGKIMNPCYKFIEEYGKWIVAAILFLLAFHFFKNALKMMP